MKISTKFRGYYIPQFVKHTLLVVFVLCFSVGFTLQAQAQIEPLECSFIDDFENSTEVSPPVELSPENPGPLNILDNGSPGVLGTFRNITFGPSVGIMNSTINIEDGGFSLSNDVGTMAPVTILYNANGAGLNADLSDTTLIRYLLIDNDLIGTSGNLIITDSGNNSANFLIPNLPNNEQGDTLPILIDFTFSDFDGIENVNLSDIESIEWQITPGGPDVDILLADLDVCQPPTREVPTLSQWGLIAMAGILGFVGFMVMKRRRLTA